MKFKILQLVIKTVPALCASGTAKDRIHCSHKLRFNTMNEPAHFDETNIYLINANCWR